MIRDFLEFNFTNVLFWLLENVDSARSVVIALAVMVIALWVMGLYWTRLWNRKYAPTLAVYLFTTFVALVTGFGMLFLIASGFSSRTAHLLIAQWATTMVTETTADASTWHSDRVREALGDVRALGNGDPLRSDITDHGRLPAGPLGSILLEEESYRTVGRVYARSAIKDFRRDHAFLAFILAPDQKIAEERVADVAVTRARDAKKSFHTADPIDIDSSIKKLQLSSGEVLAIVVNTLVAGAPPEESRWVGEGGMVSRLWRIVATLRISLIAIIILLQVVVFGGNFWSSYRRIKVGER